MQDQGDLLYIHLCVSFPLFILSIKGILGTKEYRKPEWVTQMEEMQEALRGKTLVYII